jgi:CheY-like chemotaxis protein
MPLSSILLAEDDENDVFIMQRAFKKAGIANPLAVVRNGEEAIEFLSRNNAHITDNSDLPALLLLDLKMPKKNGFDVLRWVRQHPPLNRLVTVVLTSSRESSDIRRAYDLHANSFLVKRTDIEQMAEMIKCLHSYWLGWNESPDRERSIFMRV